jgi:hypothetical protein
VVFEEEGAVALFSALEVVSLVGEEGVVVKVLAGAVAELGEGVELALVFLGVGGGTSGWWPRLGRMRGFYLVSYNII